MAKITYFDGNQGFSGRFDLDRYLGTVAFTPGITVLSLVHENGSDVQPREEAYRIEMTFHGIRTATDPEDGSLSVTAGFLRQVRYFDATGAETLRFEALGLDAVEVGALLADGGGSGLFDLMTVRKDLFLGSDVSAGAFGGNQDDFRTGRGHDTVRANDGDDYIRDGGGADLYDGGLGHDAVTYDSWRDQPAQARAGIVWDVAGQTVLGPDGRIDRLISIEEVRGTHRDDRFVGNGAALTAIGMGGNDRFEGSAGVWDKVVYANEFSGNGGRFGVRVDLAAGTARDAFGDTDTLIGIDAVVGTEKRDVLRDNAEDNFFDGQDGDDLLVLRGGDDVVIGGAGADHFRFVGRFATDTVLDFNFAEGDRLTLAGFTSFAALTVEDSEAGLRLSTDRGSVVLQGLSAEEALADWFVA